MMDAVGLFICDFLRQAIRIAIAASPTMVDPLHWAALDQIIACEHAAIDDAPLPPCWTGAEGVGLAPCSYCAGIMHRRREIINLVNECRAPYMTHCMPRAPGGQ